jgi:hypothetical protein
VDFDIENRLHRILSGFYTINISGVEYTVMCPTLQLLHKAQKKYLQILDDNKFDNSWFSSDLINYLLISNNLWNNTKEKEFNELHKILDNTKKQLYIKYVDSKTRNTLKNLISQTKLKINSMYNDKHYFYHLTLEAYAQSIKSEFIITQSVYSNNELVFKDQDLDNLEVSLLHKISEEMSQNILTIDNIKYISRQDLWRSYWNCGKEHLFNLSGLSMTDEQRTLINLSKTYDAIKEHPEAPADEIFSDDDALDGWVIFQNDKAKKEKAQQQAESKYGLSNKRADEVFILTDSQEEIQEIFNLNDDEARANIKELRETVKQKGEVQWQELPFIDRELRQKFNQIQPSSGKSCRK